MTFDIQGVPVTAEVLNIRKVEWQTFRANFFVIFSAGALEGAPVAYLGTARVPAGADGLVLFTRFHRVDIDVDELEIVRTLPLSDSSELALRLRAIALRQKRAGIGKSAFGRGRFH